jgi:PAS domain S-box-containing protein
MSGFVKTTEEATQGDLATLQESLTVLGNTIDRQRTALAQIGPARPGTPQAHLHQSLAEMNALLPRLRSVTNQLMRKLENQQRERSEMEALLHVTQVVNSSLDLDQVLNQVMDQIIQLSQAERGFLMLTNNAGELEFRTARNMDQETIQDSEFNISRTIVQRVKDQGEPVVTTNAQEDPRFSAQESVVSYNLRSILCVPLRVKENVTGVVYADNRIKSGLFGERDRDILTAFANQAAIAIDNARLFASVVDAKNLMDNIFASITSGVITTDVQDQITLFNQAAEQILGLPAAQVEGAPYVEVLHPLRDQISPLVQAVKTRDEPVTGWEIEQELPSRGTVNLNLSLSPLKDSRQTTTGVAIVMDDLTERRRLEARTRYIRDVLMSYLAPQVAEQLLADPEKLRLGGERRIVTTFFADIRGFTTFSEQLDPERLMDVLNRYLSLGADAVFLQEGTLDKFQGDMVMAFFNAPVDQEDHALRAVRAALTMRADIQTYHQEVDPTYRLNFGIGINTGEAVVGNVGTAQIKNYTIIGDSVNLAKRLQEGAAPNQILLGSSTYELVKDYVVTRELESAKVKGRAAVERVIELIDLKDT